MNAGKSTERGAQIEVPVHDRHGFDSDQDGGAHFTHLGRHPLRRGQEHPLRQAGRAII